MNSAKLDELVQKYAYKIEVELENSHQLNVKMFSLQDLNQSYQMQFILKGGILRVQLEKGLDTLDDLFEEFEKFFMAKKFPRDLYEEIIQFIVSVAKEEKVAAVFLNLDCEHSELLWLYDFHKKNHYEQSVQIYFEQCRYDTDILLLNKPALMFMKELEVELARQLSLVKKNDCTFEWESGKDVRVGIKVWRYYHEGYEGELSINMKEGHITLEETTKGDVYSLTTKEEIAPIIQSVLQKASERTRIRNLTTPPNRHFERFFQYELEENKEKIHSMLLNTCTYREVERIAANGSIRADWKIVKGLRCLSFGPYYLAQSTSKGEKAILLFTTKAELKNFIMEKVEQEIDDLMESIV